MSRAVVIFVTFGLSSSCFVVAGKSIADEPFARLKDSGVDEAGDQAGLTPDFLPCNFRGRG